MFLARSGLVFWMMMMFAQPPLHSIVHSHRGASGGCAPSVCGPAHDSAPGRHISVSRQVGREQGGRLFGCILLLRLSDHPLCSECQKCFKTLEFAEKHMGLRHEAEMQLVGDDGPGFQGAEQSGFDG